jgi:hypothetical protein
MRAAPVRTELQAVIRACKRVTMEFALMQRRKAVGTNIGKRGYAAIQLAIHHDFLA